MPRPPRIVPVLLAGGAGTRLAPLSTPACPKPFVVLPGRAEPLFDAAWRMAEAVASGDALAPVVVTTAAAADACRAALERVGAASPHVLIEPEARNTGAAALLAALTIRRRTDADALMWLLPCDLVLEAEPATLARWLHGVAAKVQVAAADTVALFGVPPTRVDTGFGYIRTDADAHSVTTPHTVQAFHEKPDAATAAQWLTHGHCFWNSGMALASAATLCHWGERLAPATVQALRAEPPHYSSLPAVPVDRLLWEPLAAQGRVRLWPFPFPWQDLGTWDRLHGTPAESGY